MLKIQSNVSLLPYNTFHVDVKARHFVHIESVTQLQELISTKAYQEEEVLMLGSGSNMLFTKDFQGLVARMATRGIEVVGETTDRIHIKVAAGELWHTVVLHCVANNWGGIENLSLIPGTVGAAPIQNIGAYGVEVSDVIESVEVMDTSTGQLRMLNRADCHFGYRESVFKTNFKKIFFISSVTLSLTKKNHIYHVSYGAIQDTLKQQNISSLSVSAVSQAVIQIRQSKLPDPSRIGNAGSFFKNPTVSLAAFEILKKEFPLIPSYPTDNQNVKIPAGWLIDQCGWKGKRVGHVGVHPMQALVLVNYGGGTGEEIFQLSSHIFSSVKERFGVILSPEVNIF